MLFATLVGHICDVVEGSCGRLARSNILGDERVVKAFSQREAVLGRLD